MNRKNLASIFGVLAAAVPFFGFSPSFETGLIVLFGLAVPFVLLLPRAQVKQVIPETLSSNGETSNK